VGNPAEENVFVTGPAFIQSKKCEAVNSNPHALECPAPFLQVVNLTTSVSNSSCSAAISRISVHAILSCALRARFS
jgi:hypothetical protein